MFKHSFMKNINIKIVSVFLFVIFCYSAKAQHAHSNTFVNTEEWYFFTPDKLNLYIHEFGTGDTVLVLHGGFGAEHSYLMDALLPLQNKFHFISFDQRGSLRSPAPDSLLSYDKLLGDIELIRKEMKLGKLTIFAHSMGTRLAMAYAVKHPDNVKKLILTGAHKPVSTNGSLRELAIFYLENREIVEEVKMQALPSDTAEWTKKHNTYNWRISFASVSIYDVTKWRRMRGGVAFYNQQSGSILYQSAPENWNYVNQLKKVGVSIAVIEGDHDYLNFTAQSVKTLAKKFMEENQITAEEKEKLFQISPVRWSDFLKDLPNLRIYSIKNAGHNVWIDQSEIFTRYFNEAVEE